ncbi:uncharacterized protein ATC70_003972 [Mucor velutinosus]|uniref:Ion transport domain-containing protein n=1 Tax=Mucor velutinosus TaxID=708070 RepID=A0AAN7HXG7_9FUNG|nr:hypothetical protein ATC70_003972 [Mucor velutinosus]
MSEHISPAIDRPEGNQGANHEDGDQVAQVQHLLHSIEPTITNRQSTDTIIPMDEVASITSNSLAQQNDQEQSDSSSLATSRDDKIPLVIEKAILIDISADKKWIASIVERPDALGVDKQIYLKMNKFYDDGSETLDGTGYFIEENITKHMPKDMGNYFYFLSVSSNGERVAVSFLPAEELSKLSSLRLHLPCAPKCLVFQVVFQMDGNAKIELENNTTKVQGKAVFLSSSLLAVFKIATIMIYDLTDAYNLKRWYEINSLFYSARSKLGFVRVSWSDTHLLNRTSSVNQHQADGEPIDSSLTEAYLQLSAFMKDNVMVSAHDKNIIRVWSLENGCRLTSFQTSTPEVPLALSDDNNFIATFSKAASLVNIYHMKTGLVSNTLRTTLGNDLCSKHHLNHQMFYAQFHDSGKLLFLIQVRPLKRMVGSKNALITFEGWDIAAEKSIIKQTRDIKVNWKVKNSYVRPFIVEKCGDTRSLYTALYTTLVDNDDCEFQSLDLDVFKPRDASGDEGDFTYNWIPLSTSEALSEKQKSYDELVDNLNDFSNATCFRLKENPNVVMRIGRHTVQLWHVSDLKSRKEHSSQDRLIYICVFKAPVYYSNKPFDYIWYRWDASMSWTRPTTPEPRSSIDEDRDTSRQETQSGTESVMEVNNSDATSLTDFIYYWDSLGITFCNTHLENMLSISICELFDDEVADTSMEIYLPLGNLTSESYNVCTEYHYVESAINALKYIQLMPEDKRTQNSKKLYHKTINLVIRCVDQMKKEKSRYFTTTSGSNSLALLASFEDGRDILFRVVQDEELPISLFSYVSKQAVTDNAYKTESRNENALTILIESRDFALYNLVLNRVLFHAQKLGAGCYSAVTDSLIYLQSRGDTGTSNFLRSKKHVLMFEKDILKSTCQKLQFLHVEQNAQSIVSEEIDVELPSKTLHKNLKTEFADLKPKSTNEQILRYDYCRKDRLISYWGSLIGNVRARLILGRIRARLWYAVHKYNTSSDILHAFYKATAHPSQIDVCVVPYVYFCSYDAYTEDKEHIHNHWNRDDNTFYWIMLVFLHQLLKLQNNEGVSPDKTEEQPKNHLLILFPIRLLTKMQERIANRLQSRKFAYKKQSVLMQLALNQHENDLFAQKDTVLETLLYFKWKKKIKCRFILVCFVHAMYYISFSVGVLFAREVFDYTIGMSIASDAKHVLTVALMLASCGLLWYQEARQFFKMGFNCWEYFCSFYNYVDLVALTLPIVNLWQMLTDRPGLDELSAITTIVLWLHGVLRLRAIAFFGVTVETIIQLMKSVYKTLLIMLLVIFAFTNAFIVLLARKEDAYFQEQYAGFMALDNLGSSTESTVNYSDNSSSNNFRNPFKAFSTLWFFIFGVWDPINDGDAGDDYMIMVLAILFSLLTVLLFFNLVM